MDDCIFCKIVKGEIPADKVYEDDKILAFKDLNPMAPVHILFVPKEHICCAEKIDGTNSDIVAHIFEVIPKIAGKLGLENGFRVVTNCKEEAGQTVFHLHFHLLGGKTLNTRLA